MSDFQTGLAVGAAVGWVLGCLAFMCLVFMKGAHDVSNLERDDEQPYVSEGYWR